jgi:hypothetical protein
MTAVVVGAVDEHAANAHVAHFTERDLLRAGEGGHVHTPIEELVFRFQ